MSSGLCQASRNAELRKPVRGCRRVQEKQFRPSGSASRAAGSGCTYLCLIESVPRERSAIRRSDVAAAIPPARAHPRVYAYWRPGRSPRWTG